MITISTNVAVGAGSALIFAGFMLGYAIAWRQRGNWLARALADSVDPDRLAAVRADLEAAADPGMTTLVVGDLEARFRRSQG